jgi:hypothetical protein
LHLVSEGASLRRQHIGLHGIERQENLVVSVATARYGSAERYELKNFSCIMPNILFQLRVRFSEVIFKQIFLQKL